MSLKIPVGQVDVVKQGDGYNIRIWNGNGFERLSAPNSGLKKEQIQQLRNDLNAILKVV